MNQKLKNRMDQLFDVLNYPGILKARRSGIYFSMYKMLYKIKKQGIEPNTILDVGASIGMFSKTANYLWQTAKIYSFEPLNTSYKKLIRLVDRNPNIELFNFALGDKREKTTINESSYEYSSSIFEMSDIHKNAFPYSADSKRQEIEIYTIDEIFSDKKILSPVLLKLDVQGFELNVLKGGLLFIKNVNYILIELSFKELYNGQPLFNELYSFLSEKGFELIDILDSSRNPNTFEMLQVDALFCKTK